MIVKANEPDVGLVTGRVVLFPMTSDQYEQLPECTHPLELLNGEVVLSPRPQLPHQKFIGRLFAVLDRWVVAGRLGEVYPEVEMRLNDEWTPAPDLVFVKAEHLARVSNARILGPVDLAVEVLSPSNEADDRGGKFAAYAEHGIPWYWIADLERRVLEEYELVGSAYSNRVDAPFDRPFTPRLFPGLTVDLAGLGS